MCVSSNVCELHAIVVMPILKVFPWAGGLGRPCSQRRSSALVTALSDGRSEFVVLGRRIFKYWQRFDLARSSCRLLKLRLPLAARFCPAFVSFLWPRVVAAWPFFTTLPAGSRHWSPAGCQMLFFVLPGPSDFFQPMCSQLTRNNWTISPPCPLNNPTGSTCSIVVSFLLRNHHSGDAVGSILCRRRRLAATTRRRRSIRVW